MTDSVYRVDMTATWTRKAPGHYTADNMEIRRNIVRYGDAASTTVTYWHLSIDGTRMDTAATLTRAKARAEELPAIQTGAKCWGRGCANPATGLTPRTAISLHGEGTIPTCDRCHRSFTGRSRDWDRRNCQSSDCSRPAAGVTYWAGALMETCNGCHRYYTGEAR